MKNLPISLLLRGGAAQIHCWNTGPKKWSLIRAGVGQRPLQVLLESCGFGDREVLTADYRAGYFPQPWRSVPSPQAGGAQYHFRQVSHGHIVERNRADDALALGIVRDKIERA